VPIGFCEACRKAWVFDRLMGGETCCSCNSPLKRASIDEVRSHLTRADQAAKGGEAGSDRCRKGSK
jgi:hypothetical protein